MLTDMPFALPDWMPAWMFLLLAVPVLLYVLAFLLMPFSVFGVKARLEALEAQIESLQDELRVMSMRSAGVLPRGRTTPERDDDVPDFAHLKKSQRVYAEPVATQVTPRAPGPVPAMRPRPSVTAAPTAAPAPMPQVTPVMPARERLTPSPAPRDEPRSEPRNAPRNLRRAEPRLD
jgi:hypothetical protein